METMKFFRLYDLIPYFHIDSNSPEYPDLRNTMTTLTFNIAISDNFTVFNKVSLKHFSWLYNTEKFLLNFSECFQLYFTVIFQVDTILKLFSRVEYTNILDLNNKDLNKSIYGLLENS